MIKTLIERQTQACEQQDVAIPHERTLVERSLERVTLKRGEIEPRLMPQATDAAGNEAAGVHGRGHEASTAAATIILALDGAELHGAQRRRPRALGTARHHPRDPKKSILIGTSKLWQARSAPSARPQRYVTLG